jgi:uncharacterized protein DUF4325
MVIVVLVQLGRRRSDWSHYPQSFSRGEQATVSFRGVDNVPSSFVNGAFVTLLDDFDFEFIKRHLSVIESNRSINQMIRRRLQFEAERRRPEAQPRPVFTRT